MYVVVVRLQQFALNVNSLYYLANFSQTSQVTLYLASQKRWPPGCMVSFHYVLIGKLMGKTLKNLLLKSVVRIENNLAEMVTK